MESKGTDRPVCKSDSQIAQSCGVSRPSVIDGIRQLCGLGLLEPVGEPVKQVQAYRILHWAFRHVEADAEKPGPRRSAAPMLHCARCKRAVRSVAKTGWCSGCTSDALLSRKVDGALIELGSDATPEQLAAHLKNYKLATKIRRMIEARTA